MRLTRRGKGVVAIVIGAAVAAFLHGPRGLDAVIAPGLVALAVGVVQVWRVDPPEIERQLPDRGTREGTVTVTIDVDIDDTVGGRFHDEVGEGLSATGNDRIVTLAGGAIEYDLSLPERGEHAVGPLSIEITDVLGLAAVTYRYDVRDEILVRPRVLPISIPPGEIYPEYGDFGPERGDFDYLREYEPGDPTHDIHWKSSAKTADGSLLVSEFSASEEGIDAITVAVDAVSGTGDETADAAASLVVFLMEAGLEVGLRTVTADVEPGLGLDHRNDLLDALARFDTGRLGNRHLAESEVHVSGTDRGVLIETGERTIGAAEVLDGTGAKQREEKARIPA